MENEMTKAPIGAGTAGTAGTSGIGSDFGNDTLIHIVMPKEEYDDLLNMRQFIYDNQLVMKYEMYLDVLESLKNQENELSRFIVDDTDDIDFQQLDN